MMNINNIVEEQIWTTLIHINREYICKRIKLEAEEKEAIIKMIEKIMKKNNKKYVNQIKSLDKLLNNLNIKIVSDKDKFKVKKITHL
jgi:ribosomal protein S8